MLFDTTGRTLLIRRSQPPRQGEWSLPGGGQELGETVEAAARRELAEETGCTAGTLSLVEVVDSIVRDKAGRVRFHYTLVDFCGVYAGGAARPASDVAELVWATPAAILDYRLWPPTLAVIGRAAALLAIKGYPAPPPGGASPAQT